MSNNEVPIQINEGETVDEAIARIAATLNVPAPQADQQKTKRQSPKRVTVTDPNAGAPVDGSVFEAVHIYQRQNMETGERETEGQVRTNAMRERRMFGPNVLVFQHMHSFGETCTPACREKVYDPDKDES